MIHQLQRLHAVGSRPGGIARLLQDGAHQRARALVVLDNENVEHASLPFVRGIREVYRKKERNVRGNWQTSHIMQKAGRVFSVCQFAFLFQRNALETIRLRAFFRKFAFAREPC